MEALDTNVLIRYLVQDDPVQSRRAALVVERAHNREERLFLSLIVLCETFWVLDYRYKHTRSEITEGLARLLRMPVFVVERKAMVESCLLQYESGKAGLADYLIGAIAREAGCHETITFDRDLKGSPGFRVL